MLRQLLASLLALVVSQSAFAGEADVTAADAVHLSNGVWEFRVTVLHADEGWSHYADRFDIVGPDGTVLGVRTLHHPHETEQPFTRSLSGVAIPDTVSHVIIRAHDNVHKLGGKELKLALPR